jgi:hypothetical protein
MLTAEECLQSAEVCLALAHKTKELDTRADLLEFAYEFRTVAKLLERDERRAALPIPRRTRFPVSARRLRRYQKNMASS